MQIPHATAVDSQLVGVKARSAGSCCSCCVLEAPLRVEVRCMEGSPVRKGCPSGTMAMNIPAYQPSSLEAVEAALQELAVMVERRQALLEKVVARIEALEASNREFQQRQVLLARTSKGHQDVIKQHILESVFGRLQMKFRPIREGENWTKYVLALHKDNKQWFVEREFDINVNLLMRYQDTPTEADNDAAHAPADDVVDRAVAECDPIWARLWRFAKTGD